MKKALNALIIIISLLSLSAGLFGGFIFFADRLEQKDNQIKRLQKQIVSERRLKNQLEINAIEILSQYYGNGIKRLDKIPADSLEIMLKKAGF